MWYSTFNLCAWLTLGMTATGSVFMVDHTHFLGGRQGGLLWIHLVDSGLCFPLPLLRQLLKEHVLSEEMFPTCFAL